MLPASRKAFQQHLDFSCSNGFRPGIEGVPCDGKCSDFAGEPPGPDGLVSVLEIWTQDLSLVNREREDGEPVGNEGCSWDVS